VLDLAMPGASWHRGEIRFTWSDVGRPVFLQWLASANLAANLVWILWM